MSAETKGEAATSALTFYDLLIEVKSPDLDKRRHVFIMTRMNTEQLVKVFHQIVATVSSGKELSSCWRDVLEITGQRGNAAVASVDIQSDLERVVLQVKNTLNAEPPSPEIRLLWFGLFDASCSGQEYAGYYLAGWTNEEQPNKVGPPPYFPESRYMRSKVLDAVKGEAVRIGGKSPETYEEFRELDYALMFGAAATLSRFVALALGVGLPIYVGFDSGDFARIAN